MGSSENKHRSPHYPATPTQCDDAVEGTWSAQSRTEPHLGYLPTGQEVRSVGVREREVV